MGITNRIQRMLRVALVGAAADHSNYDLAAWSLGRLWRTPWTCTIRGHTSADVRIAGAGTPVASALTTAVKGAESAASRAHHIGAVGGRGTRCVHTARAVAATRGDAIVVRAARGGTQRHE